MRRSTVILVACLLIASFGMVAGQGAPSQPVGMNPVGQPMPIYNFEGAEVARVTVTEVIDPFEDWAEYYDPAVDERYVVVATQIENTGERPFEFATFDFQLLDSLGRLYSGGYFERSPESLVALPELEVASMLPGETAVGGLKFTIPVDSQLTQLVYTFYGDGGQQLYLVADLTGAAVATPGA